MDTSKQKGSSPKAPHYSSAYSFVCLLNVFAHLRPFPALPHCSFPCHSKSCDYKQIHTLWLSQTCSISWRRNLCKAVKHHFGSDEMVWMSRQGKWHGSHQALWQAAQFSSFQTSLTSNHTSLWVHLCERNQVRLSTKHTNINKTNTLAQRYKMAEEREPEMVGKSDKTERHSSREVTAAATWARQLQQRQQQQQQQQEQQQQLPSVEAS